MNESNKGIKPGWYSPVGAGKTVGTIISNVMENMLVDFVDLMPSSYLNDYDEATTDLICINMQQFDVPDHFLDGLEKGRMYKEKPSKGAIEFLMTEYMNSVYGFVSYDKSKQTREYLDYLLDDYNQIISGMVS